MIVYFISPIGAKSPGLFETFTETFQAAGHTITDDVQKCTVVFFDSHSGYLPYDKEVLKYVLDKSLPVVWFDAFDYHGDSSKHWFGLNNWKPLESLIYQHDWANFLWLAKEKCKLVYFMRKMQIGCDYGSFVYPLELTLFPDHDFPLVSKEELAARPFDACFIGCKSPRREQFINLLQQDGQLKLYIQFTEERIPHDEWLNRHRQAKFFIEADGGGLGSERPYQLITIAPMIKQANQQLIVNDFKSGSECIKMGITTDIKIEINWLVDILKQPEILYDIYISGVEKMKTYFNAEYRANYILSILNQNDIY